METANRERKALEKIIPAGFEVSDAPIKIIKINKKIEYNILYKYLFKNIKNNLLIPFGFTFFLGRKLFPLSVQPSSLQNEERITYHVEFIM